MKHHYDPRHRDCRSTGQNLVTQMRIPRPIADLTGLILARHHFMCEAVNLNMELDLLKAHDSAADPHLEAQDEADRLRRSRQSISQDLFTTCVVLTSLQEQIQVAWKRLELGNN